MILCLLLLLWLGLLLSSRTRLGIAIECDCRLSKTNKINTPCLLDGVDEGCFVVSFLCCWCNNSANAGIATQSYPAALLVTFLVDPWVSMLKCFGSSFLKYIHLSKIQNNIEGGTCLFRVPCISVMSPPSNQPTPHSPLFSTPPSPKITPSRCIFV